MIGNAEEVIHLKKVIFPFKNNPFPSHYYSMYFPCLLFYFSYDAIHLLRIILFQLQCNKVITSLQCYEKYFVMISFFLLQLYNKKILFIYEVILLISFFVYSGISAEMREEIKEIVREAVEPLTKSLRDLAIDHNISNYDVWTETSRSEVEQKEFKDAMIKYYKRGGFFTRKFKCMCFLAGKIRDKFATDTLGYLTMLFGPSGVGFCHEYDAHNFFCGLTSASHPCWSFTTKKWMNMPLGNGPRQKVTFRNIKNISGALLMSRDIPQRYLLPNVTNLALIDSIIPMDTVLQMTVSNFHRGATNRMTDIHKELGEPRTVKMIFVVPGHIVSTFIFPTNMPEYVQMFVTVAKVMTLSEARKFRAG
mmetsp:Transcript_30631/g.41932  ORF Transcript_30631/g.41932 Transcript_30631/m.41932 type:complete len:363 (-) Transcript_30631:70-1158(-)